jgi:predicted NACHT family NTPase
VCAVRCLAYIDERSGLIAPDGNDTYAFVHLTLQEHCAGRYIALQSENLIDLVMQHRADDRWREPIFLGMGVADPRDINEVLQTLIERDEPHNEPRASGLCW